MLVFNLVFLAGGISFRIVKTFGHWAHIENALLKLLPPMAISDKFFFGDATLIWKVCVCVHVCCNSINSLHCFID